MAEAFFNHHAGRMGSKHLASSAGTHPLREVNPQAIHVMHEIGIDISRCIPKEIPKNAFQDFDLFITMGCVQGCPVTPRERTVDWNIDDPARKDVKVFRSVRDDIESKVLNLLSQMT